MPKKLDTSPCGWGHVLVPSGFDQLGWHIYGTRLSLFQRKIIMFLSLPHVMFTFVKTHLYRMWKPYSGTCER